MSDSTRGYGAAKVVVLSRDQMRAFDACAINECGVSGLLLMENAGRGAVDVLERGLLGGAALGKRVVVVAGTGNNGGDGFVVARHLAVRGAEVSVVLCGDLARFTPDARANHDAWVGIDGDVTTELDGIASADVLVDALFGTGLDRLIDGADREAIVRMNDAGAPIFAIDIPSGIHADRGEVMGVAVRATATATFAHYKRGLLTPNGAAHAGVLTVVDIGVPAELVRRTGHDAQLITDADARRWLSPRALDVHKYRAGHVLVIAGSPGKTGAAALAARGASKAGAGAATVATWVESAAAIEALSLECMTARLDASRLDSVDALLQGKSAVVIGPGLGTDERARRVVGHVLMTHEGVVVVDADALSTFAGHAIDLARAKAKLILTPHAGEAARLLSTTSVLIESDRYAAVRSLAKLTNAVVLLKGAHTLIADPAGRVVVCPVVCPALATAGSGDVLAGIIGAFACGAAPFEAAALGALVHGRAGEAWSRAHGDRGLLAGELASRTTDAIAALLSAHASASTRTR